MPFQSKAQQRFMFAKHPKMAKEWAAETKDFKKLPEKKGKTKKAAPSSEKEQTTPSLGKRFLASLGAGTAVGAVGAGVNNLALRNLHKGELGQKTRSGDIDRLKKSMGYQGAVVNPNERLRSAMYAGFDDKGMASVPRKAGPHIAAHEFGHAVLRRSTAGKALAGMRAASPLAGAASGFMSMTDPDSATSKAAPIVAGLAHAPTLIDEGIASAKALGGMRRAGYSAASQVLAKRQLLKAFGTYGIAAGTAVGAPLASRKLIKWMKNRENNMQAEKQAMHPAMLSAFEDELSKIAEVEKTALNAATMGRVADKAVKRGWSGARENLSLMRLAKREGRAVERAVAPHANTAIHASNAPTQVPKHSVSANTVARPPPAGAAGGTQAGVAPNSIKPANNLKRNLAIGGGIAAVSGAAGYAMPHRQQQQ